MINDKTIDVKTAKYYCAFADKKILQMLDDAMNHSKTEGKKFQKVAQQAVNANKKVDEASWNTIQAMHQAAFPMATGNPFQPNFRAMDPNSGVPSLQDQQRNNVIAGAASAALVGATCVPGGWAALTSAIAGVGGWVGSMLGTIAGTAASIGTAGVIAIIGGIVSVSTYLYPRIAKLLDKVCRSGIIAKCEFDADGEKYIAIFSLSKGKWQLLYQGGRWTSSNVHVPTNDIVAFFDSSFFNNFLAQCKKYVDAIYNNPKRIECLKVLAKMSDKASQKDMQKLLDANKTINDYMLTAAYITK